MEAYLRLRRESGFYLNTLSYSLQEHIILQKALKLKFDLETNIHRHDNKYKLYIKAEYAPTHPHPTLAGQRDSGTAVRNGEGGRINLETILLPFFSESFYYKLYNKPK